MRENTEGEYSTVGGRMFAGTDREFVVQETVFTRIGVDRVLQVRLRARAVAAEEAPDLGHQVERHLDHDAVLGRARRGDGQATIPTCAGDKYHIDILTAHFVLHPDWFDVVVGSNLFGDILSDLGPACTGTIGIAPSGNINPERTFPSLFEPVHGSAPDIAGQGIANPIGQIWSGAMMLEHLGQQEAAAAIVPAIERVLGEKTCAPAISAARRIPSPAASRSPTRSIRAAAAAKERDVANIDLRNWISAIAAAGELKLITGAEPKEEIGGIVDIYQRRMGNPAVMFDEVPGFPKGTRVLANILTSVPRINVALGLPPNGSELDLVLWWRSYMKAAPSFSRARSMAVRCSTTCSRAGRSISQKIPTPVWHEHDGGPLSGRRAW